MEGREGTRKEVKKEIENAKDGRREGRKQKEANKGNRDIFHPSDKCSELKSTNILKERRKDKNKT